MISRSRNLLLIYADVCHCNGVIITTLKECYVLPSLPRRATPTSIARQVNGVRDPVLSINCARDDSGPAGTLLLHCVYLFATMSSACVCWKAEENSALSLKED